MLHYLHKDARIDGCDVISIGKQGVDVDFLDFSGKTQERRQADDDFGLPALVDALLPARTF